MFTLLLGGAPSHISAVPTSRTCDAARPALVVPGLGWKEIPGKRPSDMEGVHHAPLCFTAIQSQWHREVGATGSTAGIQAASLRLPPIHPTSCRPNLAQKWHLQRG